MAVWSGTKSSVDYVKKLSLADKRRYLEKTTKDKDIGDPYAYTLSTLDQEELPPVMSFDSFNYLVLTTSFCTSERFKAYKSLDAYKYFISGFDSSVAVSEVIEVKCHFCKKDYDPDKVDWLVQGSLQRTISIIIKFKYKHLCSVGHADFVCSSVHLSQ